MPLGGFAGLSGGITLSGLTRFTEVARCAKPRPVFARAAGRGAYCALNRVNDANWPSQILQLRSWIWLHPA
jgi:hypothetical protein